MSRQGKVEAFEYIADADLAASGGLVEGPKTKINIENLAAGAVPDASTTVKGKVELATVAEAEAGTDTTRAVTPEGVAAAIAAAGGQAEIRLIVSTGTPSIEVDRNTTGAGLSVSTPGTGQVDITADQPIFTSKAYLYGGVTIVSGSSFLASLRKVNTTVLRVYIFVLGTETLTNAAIDVPVLVDILP